MNKQKRFSVLTLFLMLAAMASVRAQSVQSDDIVGKWLSFKDDRHRGTIEIYKTEKGLYEGKIIWGENAGRKDSLNPDPTLRTKPVVGLVILRNFKYEGENDWSGGRIYDPDNGKEYKSYMELEDDGKDKNTLRLRGYIGFSFIGRTAIWKRAKE
ncbi:MAG: DUF2147 domain-containing protein [Chlorobiales bacterium]|jgi:uncharacterized protein (DUF2147 family)|nr:DUF2147 domain-containing protein [Chlorobiales bacterium]